MTKFCEKLQYIQYKLDYKLFEKIRFFSLHIEKPG